MRRGEVWWADMPEPAGRRPVVLLSRDEAYSVRTLVVAAPVTTRVPHIRAEVDLGPEDGLSRRCAANLDTVTTIPTTRLRERIASLRPEKLLALDAAIHFALGLDRCPDFPG